jgi:sec-independent protein translocase protein TatC
MDSTENKPTGVPDETGGQKSSLEPVNDATNTYNYYDDYGYDHPPREESPQVVVEQPAEPQPAAALPPAAPPPPASPPPKEEDDDEEGGDGMLRMSFLEHLEELRVRLLRMIYGIAVAFAASIYFTPMIWEAIRTPYCKALAINGIKECDLIVLTPTESFSILWVKLPILCAIFLSSPWILYQIWSFIAPGLYKNERRWAGPFIVGSAGLFVLGGVFAYYVAFPLGLGFLLGIGNGMGIKVSVTLSEYFDLFFNVTLGMGVVFELPILIFILALLRIVTPHFLLRNSRYAIMIIVIAAAIITPTPDVINLMLISVPMTLLYFTGVFAAYVLYLSREGRRLPWFSIVAVISGILTLLLGSIYLLLTRYGYKLVQSWPYLVR